MRGLLFLLAFGLVALSQAVCGAQEGSAGPFVSKVKAVARKPISALRNLIGRKGECPPRSIPLVEFRAAGRPAPERLSLSRAMEATSSSPPGTAGDRRPDAGLPSLIGLLRDGGSIKLELDDPKGLLLRGAKEPQPISVPLSQATSDSLDSSARRLPTLLTFIQVTLGVLAASQAAPWVTRLASGLLQFLAVLSPPPAAKSGSDVRLGVGSPAVRSSRRRGTRPAGSSA